MGGKNKPNRTKNNARPSSSARSAELLGSQTTTYFGLGTGKEGAISLLPGIAMVGEFDKDIDSKFHLAFKKMVKKDATTKLKALQEFTELCQKADTSIVKAILPFWPNLYGQLCGDTEHRVREAAHLSHKAVITKVKKHLAPYLKEIIGPWFTSQYDTYAPAASAAVTSFREAFSSSKMGEAIAFCQTEILDYFNQNLTVHTPQTLSNPKTNSPEEMEDKYRRVVTCSLLGYASFLQNVPRSQLEANGDANKTILASPKFWKLGQHKDPLVQHSFFTALIALCQYAPWLLTNESPRLTAAIFNQLSINDPLVLPVAWDAVLHGVTSVPECWNHGNAEKQLIPKLFQILRTGGKGQAANIFPKILPLLSKLPSEKMGDKVAFMDKLFSNMRIGLLESSVNRSQSESRVVAATFIESLQYMVMVNRDDITLIQNLVKTQLMAALESQFSGITTLQHTTLPLLCHVALLLRTWYKNSPAYDSLTNQFWLDIENIFKAKLNASVCIEDVQVTLNTQTEFMAILASPYKFMPRGNKERVKFSIGNVDEPPAAAPVEESHVPEFNARLEKFSQVMTSEYIHRFTSTDNNSFLMAVLHLVTSFDPKVIFEAAAGEKNLYELFTSCLKKDVPQNILIKLGLQLVPHLSEQLQRDVLNMLVERDDINFLLFCMELLPCSTPTVRDWVHQQQFSEMFLSLIEKYLNGEADSTAGEVLSGFFSPALLVNLETCRRALSTLALAIHSEEEPRRISVLLEASGRDACLLKEFEKVLSHLFCVACCPNGEVYEPLLRSALRKIKCFSLTGPSAWLGMAAQITCDMASSKRDAARTVAMVNCFVKAACDADLIDTCDADEIKDAAQFIKVFLEPLPAVRHCATMLKNFALVACEISSECSLKYFELKEKNTHHVPRIAPDEDVLACSPADSAILRSYRAAYTSQLETCDTPPLTGSLVSRYLEWIKISAELVILLLTAYPMSSKLEDISITGRYIVEGTENAIEGIGTESLPVESDVVPRRVSAEEFAELDAQAQVGAVFSRDEYPDQNLLVPLGNHVLDLLEGVAVLDILLKFYPEIEHYPLISSNFNSLKIKIADMISAGTPSEVEFLYNTCQALVTSEASWTALQPSLSSLMCRRFRNVVAVPTADEVAAAISEVTDSTGFFGKPYRVLKLTAIVKHHAHCLTMNDWNIVFIQLENSLKSLDTCASQDKSNLLEMAAVSSFFVVSQESFLRCLERAENEKLLPELVRMWNDIVEKELWLRLFTIWCNLVPIWLPFSPATDNSDNAIVTSEDHTCSRLGNVDCEPVFVRRLCEAVIAGLGLRQTESLEWAETLAEQCSLLLLSPHMALQITAFRLLISLVPQLVQADTEIFQNSTADTPPNEDKSHFTRTRDCKWKLKRVDHALRTAQTVVDALLSDFKAGDTCTVQPFTDAFTYAHGFLLLWCVIIEMCGEAHVALRFQYAAWLKNEEHLSALLKATFNFMPAYVTHGETARGTAPLFESYGSLKLNDAASSEWVERRACFVYRMCLQRLPAEVRDWWSKAEHHVGNFVARATSLHVSPLLIASELKAVQSAKVAELGNIVVAVSTVAREVVGSYDIDDATMQIIISLPANYPLGTIKVDFKAQNIIPRAWRISMFLVHRNGSLLDALALWKSDLDKKFEGVEECEICFSILYGPNLDIPKQSCKTCRKKFHSACLYKWFSTSNKSTCPHCRNQY